MYASTPKFGWGRGAHEVLNCPKIGKYRVPPYRTPPQLQRFYDEENCSSVLQCAIENKVKHDESLRLNIMERYHYTSNRIISTKTID